MDLRTPDSESVSNARSTRTADPYSKRTGRTSPRTKTSRKSNPEQVSLFPMCGQEDSLAKMSLWREWGLGLGLKGSSLDSFTSFLDWLNTVAPELFSSKTFRVSSLPTKDEISQWSSGLWPSSGIAWDGVYLTAKTSESPSPANECSLWDVLEKGEVPPKYFLVTVHGVKRWKSKADFGPESENGLVLEPFSASYTRKPLDNRCFTP